ncbi:MAG: NADH-quinone oxidoreductase subunit H [Thiomonas sp.]
MRVDVVLQQVCQVLVIALLCPLLHGFIAAMEEKVQRGTGPSLFQLYHDLFNWFRKEIVVPGTASWIFWVAPIVAFSAMLTVPILIPVLTNHPLPLSDRGDILGGGLILTFCGFAILLAGLDSGHP